MSTWPATSAACVEVVQQGLQQAVQHIEAPDDFRIADYVLTTTPQALRARGLFVAEGRFVVERLIALGRYRVRSLLATPAAWRALQDALASRVVTASTGPHAVYVAPQAVLDTVVGFHIHRGCLALAERPALPLLADSARMSLAHVLVLEGVSNPDNVGGLYRSAAAFGVSHVVLGPGCGDPFYRKAIRTSMGATLAVPSIAAGGWPATLRLLQQRGFELVALTPSPSATPLSEWPVASARTAVLVGGEGDGLSDEALAAADHCVRIATSSRVESLNVTVAASIALQHVFARAHDAG